MKRVIYFKLSNILVSNCNADVLEKCIKRKINRIVKRIKNKKNINEQYKCVTLDFGFINDGFFKNMKTYRIMFE